MAGKPNSFAAQLEAAGECAREMVEYRNELIYKRRRQGATLRQIAEEAGLTHTAIAKILAR